MMKSRRTCLSVVPSRETLPTLLAMGAAELGVELSCMQKSKVLDYVTLLAKWNAVYNLTAIRDPYQMMIQHVLDSLAIVPHLAPLGPSSVLDVGAGAGVPGIMLAIALPQWSITLNDIVHKKTAFQVQAKTTLGITNLSVITGRVESLRLGIDVPQKIDVIVSRAFADLSDFVMRVRNLLSDRGAIWAMKGMYPDREIERLPVGAHAIRVIRLHVPYLEAERHLVEVKTDSIVCLRSCENSVDVGVYKKVYSNDIEPSVVYVDLSAPRVSVKKHAAKIRRIQK